MWDGREDELDSRTIHWGGAPGEKKAEASKAEGAQGYSHGAKREPAEITGRYAIFPVRGEEETARLFLDDSGKSRGVQDRGGGPRAYWALKRSQTGSCRCDVETCAVSSLSRTHLIRLRLYDFLFLFFLPVSRLGEKYPRNVAGTFEGQVEMRTIFQNRLPRSVGYTCSCDRACCSSARVVCRQMISQSRLSVERRRKLWDLCGRRSEPSSECAVQVRCGYSASLSLVASGMSRQPKA